jgi:hypothetical protein
MAQQSYPQTALLKQVKGVGTLIALTYMLTLEDPHRFRKSRDVGCYAGLQPGRRNSGQSEPQMRGGAVSGDGSHILAVQRQEELRVAELNEEFSGWPAAFLPDTARDS